jgi:hypothetical protein
MGNGYGIAAWAKSYTLSEARWKSGRIRVLRPKRPAGKRIGRDKRGVFVCNGYSRPRRMEVYTIPSPRWEGARV